MIRVYSFVFIFRIYSIQSILSIHTYLLSKMDPVNLSAKVTKSLSGRVVLRGGL